MSSILVVCTANICRSPVGEASLRHYVGPAVKVASAGTHAIAGHPAAPEAIEFIDRTINSDFEHTARQLTRVEAESSDLIIAMTSKHRSWIARNAPRAVRRTFTLKELDRLLVMLPSESLFASLRELTLEISRRRSRLSASASELDIADPFGGPPEGYESSFTEVLEASRRVADAIKQSSR